MKKEATPADALLLDLSEKVAAVKDLCRTIQAAVSQRRQPNLQLMYLGAAALAQGSYPIATR